MNYLMNLFGGSNASGGMRKPDIGTGMDLYSGQAPSMNLGMGSTNRFANADTGTGVMPSASFGQMPTGFDLQSALASLGSPESLASMKSLLDEKDEEEKQFELQPVQLPMGSNQNYEDLMKMYGVRSGGLLG
jgi:hypothetical protein